MPPTDFRTGLALHGCQTETTDPVVLQHKLGIARAEHAFGVEEDDRAPCIIRETIMPLQVALSTIRRRRSA